MQRRPQVWGDVKWAIAVLAGAALAFVVLGTPDPSPLLGALAGVVVVVLARAALRRRKHERSA